jgi:hypothetical protein
VEDAMIVEDAMMIEVVRSVDLVVVVSGLSWSRNSPNLQAGRI